MKITHGGDIYRNKIRLDFSVNTNPLGCPGEVRDALREAMERIGVYPDLMQTRVREALAKLHGLEPEEVLPGNGASELILAVVRSVRPKRVLLTAPTFYGYERAAAGDAGCEIRWHQLREEDGFQLKEEFLSDLTPDTDLCFLCNPNNPTGVEIEEGLLGRIIDRCEEQGIALVVDECFFELAAKASSVLPRIRDCRGLYVLKAFTKLLAVPGVRLGYLLSTKENIRGPEGMLPEWNLSVFAEAAAISGCRVLQDGSYAERTRQLIEEERRFLTGELERLSIRVIPGCANYLFLHSEKDLYRRLLERGILIRDCEGFHGLAKGYYRLAVRTHAENETLIRTLREVL